MKKRLLEAGRWLLGKGGLLTPAQVLGVSGILLAAAFLPRFVSENLNPFVEGFTYYYEEPISGKAVVEKRKLRVGWARSRRERVTRVVDDYLQGPLEFRLKHPGFAILGAVHDEGEALVLYLKPLDPEAVSPEFRATLEDSLLRTLSSNRLCGPETRVYWSGVSSDAI
ncbi:MAG: hypothetical protein J0L75_13740 [Spirochaetes bacterium]|nr:hypothetical protein [Spirochaetota bacterium]